MKLSEAILLGSTLVKPVRGQSDDGNGGGCAYGMANRSSNCTFANPAWGDWSEAEEYAKRVVKVIIDLIPASSGALDRAIAEARKQALDEAASLVEAHDHRLLNDFESCKGLEPLSHRIRALECSAKGATDEPKSGDSL